MFIYYLIVCFFIFYTFSNYKKSLYLWAVFSLAMHTGICLKFSSPAISVLLIVNLFFLSFYYLKIRNKRKHKEKFILLPIFCLSTLSYLLSAIFGILPFTRNIVSILGQLIGTFGVLFLLDKEIKTDKDIKTILKYLSCFILISCAYGLLTLIIQSNPIIKYEISLIPDSFNGKLVDSSETFRGLKMQSFFGGATQFSTYVTLTIICISAFLQKKAYNNKYTIPLFIVALIFAFLSKTRASIFAAIITILYFFTKQKSIQFVITILILLLIFPYINSILGDNISYISSVFDSSSQEEVGGSSLEMRMEQLNAVMNIVSQYPIFGAGFGSLGMFTGRVVSLYGAESIWFQLLIYQGFLGAIAYVYIFVFTIRNISPKFNIYMISCAVFWLTQHTLSTTGLTEYFYLFSFIIIYKTDKILKSNENWAHNISRI